MSFFTERLRARIRDGFVRCHPECVHRKWQLPVHSGDCEWNNAVQMIYALERAEEASLTKPSEDLTMSTFKNETTNQVLVVVRAPRYSQDGAGSVVLLPGESHEESESAYDLQTYFRDLTEEEAAKVSTSAALAAGAGQDSGGSPATDPSSPSTLSGQQQVGSVVGAGTDSNAGINAGAIPDPNGQPGETTPPTSMTDEQLEQVADANASEVQSTPPAAPVDDVAPAAAG